MAARKHKRSSIPNELPEPPVRTGKVFQWGEALAVRIPADVARQLHLSDGVQVSLELKDRSLTVRPSRRKKWTESELLKGVTPDVVGGELEWGRPVGKEL